MGGWVGAGSKNFCGVRLIVDLLLGSGSPDVAGVRGWHPWQAGKWWDSWRLWWAEKSGEGIGLGVLLEDGDVVIPGGLGRCVAVFGSGVFPLLVCSGGMDGLGNLSWEVSGLSQVKCGTVYSTVVRVPDGNGFVSAVLGRDGGEWQVDDVTVLFRRLDAGELLAC